MKKKRKKGHVHLGFSFELVTRGEDPAIGGLNCPNRGKNTEREEGVGASNSEKATKLLIRASLRLAITTITRHFPSYLGNRKEKLFYNPMKSLTEIFSH